MLTCMSARVIFKCKPDIEPLPTQRVFMSTRPSVDCSIVFSTLTETNPSFKIWFLKFKLLDLVGFLEDEEPSMGTWESVVLFTLQEKYCKEELPSDCSKVRGRRCWEKIIRWENWNNIFVVISSRLMVNRKPSSDISSQTPPIAIRQK